MVRDSAIMLNCPLVWEKLLFIDIHGIEAMIIQRIMPHLKKQVKVTYKALLVFNKI